MNLTLPVAIRLLPGPSSCPTGVSHCIYRREREVHLAA
jgi:hypothetical protein